MKNLIVLSIFFSSILSAQFKPGNFEIGASGSLGSLTEKYKTTYSVNTSEYEESYKYFQLSTTIGYYVTEGLSIEPELGFLFFERQKPNFHLLANASYTYRIPEKIFAPFVRIGYGVSNSLPYMFNNGVLINQSGKMDVSIFNIGAGLKILVSEDVLVKTEINYRQYFYERDEKTSNIPYHREMKYSGISLFFGFAVVL